MTEIEIFSAIEEIAPTLSQKQVKAIYHLIASNIKLDVQDAILAGGAIEEPSVNTVKGQDIAIPHSSSFQVKE